MHYLAEIPVTSNQLYSVFLRERRREANNGGIFGTFLLTDIQQARVLPIQ